MKNNQTIALTLGQFLLMSEAHLKALASQGIQIAISDYAPQPVKVESTANAVKSEIVKDNSTTTTTKGSSNKPAKTKQTTKGGKKLTKGKKAANNNEVETDKSKVAYGKVKKDDYFKVINLKTNEVVHVGKAKSVSVKDDMISTKGGKKWKLSNCVAINRKTYLKLKESLKKATKGDTDKKSTSKKLSPTDYKVVYAAYLAKQGKINADEVAKAKDNAEFRSELYHKFSKELPLTNAEALKLFAELSQPTKVEPQTAATAA